MTGKDESDWDPRAESVLRDQVAAYDTMRRRCPVAYSETHHWSLFRHADVMHVLTDHHTFSNAVSAHLSVPNGMDPPEHSHYRQIIEPYFTAEAMTEFEPMCRVLARRLVNQLPRDGEVELISALAQPFAVQVQCEFLGWPEAMQQPLVEWSRKNQQATLAQDRDELVRVAEEFSGYITRMLQVRRDAGDAAPDDVTTQLMRSEVHGRLLHDSEIVSILRNWTAGEIGTIAASVGTVVHFLAAHPPLQQQLRREPHRLPEAIDEILRLHGPLVSNRRLATRPVEIGGRRIEAGERLVLNWISANRDEEAFADANEFRWGRDPEKNLLYGAGIHVCPGAPLARLELRLIMEELIRAATEIALSSQSSPTLAVYPASGFSELPLRLSFAER